MSDYYPLDLPQPIQGAKASIEFSQGVKGSLDFGFPNDEFPRASSAVRYPHQRQNYSLGPKSFANYEDTFMPNYYQNDEFHRRAQTPPFGFPSTGTMIESLVFGQSLFPSTGGKAPRSYMDYAEEHEGSGMERPRELSSSGKRPMMADDPFDGDSDGEIDWSFAEDADNFDPLFCSSPVHHTTTTRTETKTMTTERIMFRGSQDDEVDEVEDREQEPADCVLGVEDPITVRMEDIVKETLASSTKGDDAMAPKASEPVMRSSSGGKSIYLHREEDETHKRKRSVETPDKRSMIARKKALFYRTMEMLSESDESDEESTGLNGEDSMPAFSETSEILDQCETVLDKIEEDKKRVEELVSSERERIKLLERTRDLVLSSFETLEKEQTAAKLAYEETLRRMEEAKKAWDTASEMRQNKKIRIIKLDDKIADAKKRLESFRTDRRLLTEKCKTAGFGMFEKLLGTSPLPPSDSPVSETAVTPSPKINMPSVGKGPKGPLFDTMNWPEQEESSTSGSTSSSDDDDDSSSDGDGESSEDSLQRKDKKSLGEKGANEVDEESDWEAEHADDKDEHEEEDEDIIDVSRVKDPEYVQFILEHGTSAQAEALNAHFSEEEDKPEALGVILNGSMCLHCGKYDKSFWDGKNREGFVCPDCVCGKCDKRRDACKHEEFFTKEAYAMNVSDYLRHGKISKRKGITWKEYAKGENVNETLVEKYLSMRQTPKSSPAYGSGRQGKENEYKRWLRRYILHSFTKEALYNLIYLIYELKQYVVKNFATNPECKPLRCVLCSSLFVYDNDERPQGSRSTTGNGTSHYCCTACKNIFSKAWRDKHDWCMQAHEDFHRRVFRGYRHH